MYLWIKSIVDLSNIRGQKFTGSVGMLVFDWLRRIVFFRFTDCQSDQLIHYLRLAYAVKNKLYKICLFPNCAKKKLMVLTQLLFLKIFVTILHMLQRKLLFIKYKWMSNFKKIFGVRLDNQKVPLYTRSLDQTSWALFFISQ